MNQNLPKVTFLKDSELEESLAHYLCYLGKQISCGYYQDRRFLILPKILPHYGRSVFFPDLSYSKEFWQEVSRYTQRDFPFTFTPKAQKVALEILKSSDLIVPKGKIEEIEHNWRTKEKQFFEVFADLFPLFKLSRIKSISCILSPFGTHGSFEFRKHKDGTVNFNLTHRLDIPVSGIAEKILTNFIYLDDSLLALSEWEIREKMVDFLMSKTKIGQVFNFEFEPTITNLPGISENLIQESEQYMQKIGFPLKSIFAVSTVNCEPVITVNNKPIFNSFTPTEKRILTHLIEHKNEVIPYEVIGNLFWGETDSLEKFSLASIAKILEKIRKKIKNHGVYQELIYTVRGQGYVLYD